MPTLRPRKPSGFVIYPVSPVASDHQESVEESPNEDSISQSSDTSLSTPRGLGTKRRRGYRMPPKKEESDAAAKNKFESAESFSDDVSARRERGKLAQRAFRQRQIDMIRILKDENARLKDSISNISASAYTGPRELKDAIDEACRLAEVNPGSSSHYMSSSPYYADGDGGMSTQSSRSTSEQSLQNSVPMMGHGSYSWSGTDMDGQEFMDDIVPPALDGTHYSFDASQMMSYTSSAESPIGSLAQMPPSAVAELQTLHISEQVPAHSQSYTHGSGLGSIGPSFSNPHIHPSAHPQSRIAGYTALGLPGTGTASSPPSDILPYIGTSAYNVAGRVFWQSLRYGWHILKTFEQSQPTPSTDILSIIYNLFHIDATHTESIGIIKQHLACRLFVRERALSSSTTTMQYPSHPENIEHYSGSQLRQNDQTYSATEKYEASHPLAASFLRPRTYSSLPSATPIWPSMENLMAQSTELAGLKPHSHLDPLAVDERLRQILGDAYHDLQAALQVHETGSASSSISDHVHTHVHGSTLPQPCILATKRLLYTLAKNANFFPDGPRWHVDTIASAAAMWTLGQDDKVTQ